MKVGEGRRLTGPNPWLRGTGAAVEVRYDAGDAHRELSREWKVRILAMTQALHWPMQSATRRCLDGATMCFAAPIDGLHTAADIAEWAADPSRFADLSTAKRTMRERYAAERNPALVALAEFAWELDLPLLWDDDVVSLGMGATCLCWPAADLPAPAELDAARFAAIPVALITGTNGKTTTARLVTHMARAAGFHTGNTSTDGWSIDERTVEEGDWTGPGAARKVLRNPQVEMAVLETARGGMLRRGLATNQAAVAVVTNVSNDHLGEWGVDTVADMAGVKLAIRRGVRAGGTLALNAGCAVLHEVAQSELPRAGHVELAWFDRDCHARAFDRLFRHGGETATVREGVFVWQRGPHREYVCPVRDVPITFGGAAVHNVDNALAAILVARGLGLPWSAVREGLRTFAGTPADNPGRANRLRVGGGEILLDFAHNTDGVARMVALARALPGKRKAIVLGQAGDRSEATIAELAVAAAALGADRYVLKETEHYLRGRALGEVTAIMRGALVGAGVAADAIETCDSELGAVDAVLRWLSPGDLAVVLVHDSFSAALARVQAAGAVVA